jgi:hypothetical protein
VPEDHGNAGERAFFGTLEGGLFDWARPVGRSQPSHDAELTERAGQRACSAFQVAGDDSEAAG